MPENKKFDYLADLSTPIEVPEQKVSFDYLADLEKPIEKDSETPEIVEEGPGFFSSLVKGVKEVFIGPEVSEENKNLTEFPDLMFATNKDVETFRKGGSLDTGVSSGMNLQELMSLASGNPLKEAQILLANTPYGSIDIDFDSESGLPIAEIKEDLPLKHELGIATLKKGSRYFLNAPGASKADVPRTVVEEAPMAAAFYFGGPALKAGMGAAGGALAAKASKGFGLFGKTVGAVGTGGAVAYTQDQVAEMFGAAETEDDMGRVLAVALASGAGELAVPTINMFGKLFAKLRDNKKFYDSAGYVTEAGRNYLKALELPADERLNKKVVEKAAEYFEKRIVPSSTSARMIMAESLESPVKLSKGEAKRDTYQMSLEDRFLRGTGGPKAQSIMETFKYDNDKALLDNLILMRNESGLSLTDVGSGSVKVVREVGELSDKRNKEISKAYNNLKKDYSYVPLKEVAEFHKTIIKKIEDIEQFDLKADDMGVVARRVSDIGSVKDRLGPTTRSLGKKLFYDKGRTKEQFKTAKEIVELTKDIAEKEKQANKSVQLSFAGERAVPMSAIRDKERLASLRDSLGPDVDKIVNDFRETKRIQDESITLTDLENWRKRLVKAEGSAQSNTARAAITKIKKEYDRFSYDIVEQNIIKGDSDSVAMWRGARELRAKYQKDFSSIKAIQSMLDPNKELTQRESLGLIFGSSALGAKKEAVRTVKKLKSLFGVDSEVIKALKNEVYTSFIVRQKDGVFDPKRFISDVDTFHKNNPELVRNLFEPEEIRKLNTFRNVVRDKIRVKGSTEREALAILAESSSRVLGSSFAVARFFRTILDLGPIGDQIRKSEAVSSVEFMPESRPFASFVVPQADVSRAVTKTITASEASESVSENVQDEQKRVINE